MHDLFYNNTVKVPFGRILAAETKSKWPEGQPIYCPILAAVGNVPTIKKDALFRAG